MKKEYRKFKIPEMEIEVPVAYEEETASGRTIPVTMHVEGMMRYIKRAMPSKNLQDLLDDYAKFYLVKLSGIEAYPIVEKK